MPPDGDGVRLIRGDYALVSAGDAGIRFAICSEANDMSTKKSSRRQSMTFADVSELALSMPDVEGKTSWGMHAFKAGKKLFAVEPYPRPDVEPSSLGVTMSFEERDRRLAAHPDVYYLTNHWAKYPGVLVRLSRIGREELREILAAAWHYAMESGSAEKARSKTKARARRGRR